jgi:nucleotide-binding universal stress UspA family protein
MTKDEALKLALEALEDLGMKHFESTGEALYKETFTAIKEALANEALEKMAENARELGLDYEPAQRTWVGLTDDEVYRIAFELEGEHWRKIADAIEAKPCAKNT